jgi:predicted HTH transcriptional regulator
MVGLFPVVEAIYAASAFIEKHTRTGTDIGAVRRIENIALPPAVTREALINSIVHCDYSQQGAPIRLSIFDDRIEIENPGLLPFGLMLSDLRQGISKLRNRVMGRVLNKLGLVEHWGSGVQRMISGCRETACHYLVGNNKQSSEGLCSRQFTQERLEKLPSVYLCLSFIFSPFVDLVTLNII